MSHLKVKIKRPVFIQTKEDREFKRQVFQNNSTKRPRSPQQSKRTVFFFSKNNVKLLSEQNFKKIDIKNIKMKPPVALFKKKCQKLCLFLKVKCQNLILSTQLYVVCMRRRT